MDLASEILAIQSSKLQRSYIEACLLATNNLEEIASLMEIPVEILLAYEREIFPYGRYTRLRKLEYVETVSDTAERQLKLWAVTQGFEFIKWRLGFKVEISPIDGVRDMYSDCLFKAKEAFFAPSDSETSKEAIRWVTQSVSLAKILKSWVADSKEAMKDIELALEQLDGNNTTFGDLSDFDSDPDLLSDRTDFSDKEDDVVSIESLEKGLSYEQKIEAARPKIDYDLLG